jgi:hypothetical protein
MSGVSKSHSELYSPVTIVSKNWRGANLVKDSTKKTFLMELKTYKTPESVT